jgi:hypothetical protein
MAFIASQGKYLFTVIGMIVHQAVGTIQLFGKQYPHKSVGQGQR